MDPEDGDISVREHVGELDASSIGNVVVMLHEAKKDILKEIKQRTDDLHQSLSDRMDAMANNVVHKVVSAVSRSFGGHGVVVEADYHRIRSENCHRNRRGYSSSVPSQTVTRRRS